MCVYIYTIYAQYTFYIHICTCFTCAHAHVYLEWVHLLRRLQRLNGSELWHQRECPSFNLHRQQCVECQNSILKDSG